LQFLRNHRNADGRVECKDGLNAFRALLVLEYNIKKRRQTRTVWYCSPTPMVGLSARMAGMRPVNYSFSSIILKSLPGHVQYASLFPL